MEFRDFKRLFSKIKNEHRDKTMIQNAVKKTTIYRFDIFKGEEGSGGSIRKTKSVGSAYLREGLSTYTVHLKTLLKDTFYLLQNTKAQQRLLSSTCHPKAE